MRNTRECRGGADVGCVAFPVGARGSSGQEMGFTATMLYLLDSKTCQLPLIPEPLCPHTWKRAGDTLPACVCQVFSGRTRSLSLDELS